MVENRVSLGGRGVVAQRVVEACRGVRCAALIRSFTCPLVQAAQLEELPSLLFVSSSSRVSCSSDLHKNCCGWEQASCGLYPCACAYRSPCTLSERVASSAFVLEHFPFA